MCKLFYGVAVLYLACIQCSNKFCRCVLTNNTTSLYKAISHQTYYLDDCKPKSVITSHLSYYALPCVDNQGPRQKALLKQVTCSHKRNYFVCCNCYIGIWTNIYEQYYDLFFRKRSTIYRLHCAKNSLTDTLLKQLLDLCVRTEVDLYLHWTDLSRFDDSNFVQGFHNYFVLINGNERPKYVKNCNDFCEISVLLASIVLCTFRIRFSFCFLSITRLFVGTCCSVPEPFRVSGSLNGGSKSSNINSTTPSKQDNSIFEFAKSIDRPVTQSKQGKNSDLSESELKTLLDEHSGFERNNRESTMYTNTRDSRQSTGSTTVLGGEPGLQKPASGSKGIRSSAGPSPPAARSCSLHLVADHLFFTQIGQGSVRTTVRIMTDVIRGVDALFRSTDFDQDGVEDNLGFLIQDVTVLRDYDYPSINFPYIVDSTAAVADHVQYLRNFSTMDQSRYCLAVAFTNLHFQRGVWGLAWPASSSQDASPGGICERRQMSSAQQDSAASGAALYSFNTVAITFTSGEGQQLNEEAAVYVLSHELAHSFGTSYGDKQLNQTSCGVISSGRDTTEQSSTTSSSPYSFSACSIRQMNPVIVRRASCLQDHQPSLCGNSVVEEGEECDCGNADMCNHNDPCCSPSGDLANGSALDPPCSVRRSQGKACSPLSGSCCLNNCQVVTNTSTVCSQATGCFQQSWCNGRSAQCPRPTVMPQGTSCGGGSRVCVDGQCTGSPCYRHSFLPCHCRSPPSSQCKLCCKAGVNSQCLPAQNYGIVNEHGRPIYLQPGEPCNDNLTMFCDQRRQCVPLLLEYSPVTFVDTPSVKWLQKHWHYLLFFLLILLTAVVYKVKSVGNDSAHMSSLHYGKIIGICMIADSVAGQITRNIALTRYLFDRFRKKYNKIYNKQQMHKLEAVGRLKTLFPTCPLSHIVQVVNMASKEDVAVCVLLALGFPSRRFIPKLTESRFAHLSHLLPRDSMKRSALEDSDVSKSQVIECSKAFSSSALGSNSAISTFSGSSVGDLQYFKTEIEQAKLLIQEEYSRSGSLTASVSNASELNLTSIKGIAEKSGEAVDELKQPDSITPAMVVRVQETSVDRKVSRARSKRDTVTITSQQGAVSPVPDTSAHWNTLQQMSDHQHLHAIDKLQYSDSIHAEPSANKATAIPRITVSSQSLQSSSSSSSDMERQEDFCQKPSYGMDFVDVHMHVMRQKILNKKRQKKSEMQDIKISQILDSIKGPNEERLRRISERKISQIDRRKRMASIYKPTLPSTNINSHLLTSDGPQS